MAGKTYTPGSDDAKPDIVASQRSEMRDKAYEVESQPWDASALGLNKLAKGVPAYNSEDPKLALEENELKKFHQAMKKSGEDHRAPRDIIWAQCWNIYNNEFDWSQKAWWQHKAPIPKVRVAVDRAVALFRKTLLKMNPFYGLKAETSIGRTKGRYTMLLDDYHFDRAKILNELVVAFKVGLITSTAATKIFWQRTRDFRPQVYTDIKEVPTYEFGVETGQRQETTRRVEMESYYKGSLGFMALNPSNIWVIPGTRNRCIIERSECTLNEIQSLIKDAKHPDGIYESEAVGRLKEKALSSGMGYGDSDNTNQTLEGKPQSNTYLRKVVLEHYWGDIYDTSGNLVMCDASYTFAGCNAGDEVLIRKPRSNPFYHKDPPYVIGTPYVTPFSTYNRGMVEDIMEIAKAIVEMSNLIADGALYDALKAFAIDADQLDSPEEAKN